MQTMDKRKTYDKVYDPNASDVPTLAPRKLAMIEGGRYIEARDVAARFGADADALLKCDCMAGYAILVFDDEGFCSGVTFRGKRLPYSPEMFVEVAAKNVETMTQKGGRVV